MSKRTPFIFDYSLLTIMARMCQTHIEHYSEQLFFNEFPHFAMLMRSYV